MAKIKLSIPEKIIARLSIPVRITDINYGNHMGNDAMVSILHEARMQWLTNLGYTELNIDGIGLIMSDLAVEYKREVFYGNVLTIALSIGEISSVSFELFYQVSNQLNEEIAKAKTGMVCYDYAAKKVAPVPPAFLGKIQ